MAIQDPIRGMPFRADRSAAPIPISNIRRAGDGSGCSQGRWNALSRRSGVAFPLLAWLCLGGLQAHAQGTERGDWSVAEVLDWMGKESGRKFVSDSHAYAGKQIRITPGTLDREHAYEIGLMLLKSVDLAAVPDRQTGLVEILPSHAAVKRALQVFRSPQELPNADEFCTLSVTLRNATPRDVQSSLAAAGTPPQSGLSIEASGRLLVSDYSSNLRKLATLIEWLDHPPPDTSYLVSITVLEGTNGAAESVPEAFRALELPRATSLNSFKLLGNSVTRLDVPTAPAKAPPAVLAAVRFGGEHPLTVELGGVSRGTAGPAMDRIAVLRDREPTQPAIVVLQTRAELREGEWTILGSVPVGTGPASLVLLARADPSRRR